MACIAAIPETWRHWLTLNRDRGCDPSELRRMAVAAGFEGEAVEAVLADEGSGSESTTPEEQGQDTVGDEVGVLATGPLFWRAMAAAPLTRREHRPRAWRLDTELAQLYELPDLLNEGECQSLITMIDRALRPSAVTQGPADYRTSTTCDLGKVDNPLVRSLDDTLAALVGVEPDRAELIQGQRYEPGQYFKPHTDWFAPDTDEFREHTHRGGQRTWTVMVYLNADCGGGATGFPLLGRRFQPVAGLGLAWNNLDAEGRPNPHTLHEAEPVRHGRKYVITKWFRERPWRDQGE